MSRGSFDVVSGLVLNVVAKIRTALVGRSTESQSSTGTQLQPTQERQQLLRRNKLLAAVAHGPIALDIALQIVWCSFWNDNEALSSVSGIFLGLTSPSSTHLTLLSLHAAL